MLLINKGKQDHITETLYIYVNDSYTYRIKSKNFLKIINIFTQFLCLQAYSTQSSYILNPKTLKIGERIYVYMRCMAKFDKIRKFGLDELKVKTIKVQSFFC